MHEKMTGFRKEQKKKQGKQQKEKSNKNTAKNKEEQSKTASEETKEVAPGKTSNVETEEIEKKTFDNCVIFYAKQYPEDQQITIKTLLDIGYDEEFNPKGNPIDVLKDVFTDKKEIGKAMKFAAFLNDEVKENRSLDPLDLETPYNEKEIIEQYKYYIFAELNFKNIEFREKNEA